MEILIMLIVALVIFYIAKLVIAELGLPGNIVRIIYIVMALFFLLWLLRIFGLFSLPF